MAKAKVDFDKIPWDVVIPATIQAFTPFIQGITWLAISKVDKRISAINNLIAVAEIVPTIDLGLPKGIVLAAMYDKTDEALDMMNFLSQALITLPANLKLFIQAMVDEAKEEIAEIIPDIPDIPIDIEGRKPGESWLEWVERRLRETGFTPGGKGLA